MNTENQLFPERAGSLGTCLGPQGTCARVIPGGTLLALRLPVGTVGTGHGDIDT